MVKIEINILLLSNKNFQNIIKYNQSNKEEWLPSSLLLLSFKFMNKIYYILI
jgi:hypothetical protein